jgi:hypothetical protein
VLDGAGCSAVATAGSVVPFVPFASEGGLDFTLPGTSSESRRVVRRLSVGAVGAPRSRARRHGAGGPLSSNGAVALLVVGTSVALVGRDGTRTLCAGRRVCQRAGALELAKDGVFVSEEVSDKAVAEALVHCQARLLSGSQNTGRERVCQSRDICLVSRSQLDEPGEVGADRVQRRDVSETQLTERGLDDGDASFF